MEGITKEIIQEFISKNKIELSSTHAKLCVPILDRIYRKMSIGIRFSGIKVENDLICDGHHRYLASLLANYPIDRIPSVSTAATIVTEWNSILYIEEDWDTPAKIGMLNEQDAEYNSIQIDLLVALLK